MSSSSQTSGKWLSCHLYYHGDQERLISGLLRPTIRRLLHRDGTAKFFFVRYALGGPHLRLRWRTQAGLEMQRDLETSAAEFFERWPSTTSIPDAVIRQRNRVILASDPSETDDSVYADNCCRFVDYQPETERYGGPELIANSVNFFMLSSIDSMTLSSTTIGQKRTRLLPLLARRMVAQALGFANRADELEPLLTAYPPDSKAFAGVLQRADEVFEKKGASFCRLVELELQRFSKASDADLLTSGAHGLRRALDDVDAATRQRILTSQMHMTANRLGLSNPEEVYLSRLLQRARQTVAERDAAAWNHLDELLAERWRKRDVSSPTLSSILSLARQSIVSPDDAPSEDAPSEDAPSEDAPSEDAPSEDAPSEKNAPANC